MSSACSACRSGARCPRATTTGPRRARSSSSSRPTRRFLPHQLRRVAKRGSIGIGRNGTFGGNSSGDLFLALSVANRQVLPAFAPAHLTMQSLNDNVCDAVYRAAVDSIEEAIVNSMLAAVDTPRLDPGAPVCRALDPEALVAVMRRYGRM